jgi:cobalt ECF transporter T component CbiQ
MKNEIPLFLSKSLSPSPPEAKGRGLRTSFLEKGIRSLAEIIKSSYSHWDSASRNGFFQGIDARIKIFFLIFFVIIVSMKKEIGPEVLIGIFIFFLAWISRLSIFHFYKRILFLAFLFGFLISLPSAFNLVAKGEVILPVFHLPRPYHFWIYQIPVEIGITKEGVNGVAMLTLRVMNSLSLTFLILFTTPFPEIMKALKMMKIPDGLLIIATLSYRTFFLFAKTAEDMHLAKKSRRIRELSQGEARRWVAGRIAFIFGKTRRRSEEIFEAMVSRGFSGSIKIYGLGKLMPKDWLAGLSFLLIGTLLLWL